MHEFFHDAAVMLWLIIATIVGFAALVAIIVVITHELGVMVDAVRNQNNPDNQE